MTLYALKETIKMRLFTMTKIPLVAWLRPRVVDLTADRCEILIPLSRRSSNHLGAMYFGALCTGADVAGGLAVMNGIGRSGHRIDFVFKDLNARFLKRAHGDVTFICEDGAKLSGLLKAAVESTQRVEETVYVEAFIPQDSGTLKVAEFHLTISLKRRSK